MLWAFQQLKGMYPNNVTCIAHGLRLICESIRENDNSANEFIAALKKILVKPPSLQVLYKEVTGLHFPQFSVITRWGTWIRCYKYLPDVIQSLEEEGMEEEEEVDECWRQPCWICQRKIQIKFEEQSRCENLCNFD